LLLLLKSVKDGIREPVLLVSGCILIGDVGGTLTFGTSIFEGVTCAGVVKAGACCFSTAGATLGLSTFISL